MQRSSKTPAIGIKIAIRRPSLSSPAIFSHSGSGFVELEVVKPEEAFVSGVELLVVKLSVVA